MVCWSRFVAQTSSVLIVASCHQHQAENSAQALLLRAIRSVRRRLGSMATAADDDAAEQQRQDNLLAADDIAGYAEIVNELGQSAYEKMTADCRIRIEKEAAIKDAYGSIIQTRSAILDQLARARAAQQSYGNAELLERQWEWPLETTEDTRRQPKNKSFTVMQFNTLAEGLSAGPDTVRPFRSASSAADGDSTSTTTAPKPPRGGGKDVYGGFDAVLEPSVVLDFAAARRWRLLEVILGGGRTATTSGSNHDNNQEEEGAHNHRPLLFDLIALEEVDRFYGFFAPALQLFGYEGVFTPKRGSPGCRNGWYSDGCCLFWQKETFHLLGMKRYRYTMGTQVYMIVVLRHRPTEKVLVVAVTHLKAQASAAHELVRSRQAQELVECVAKETELAIARYHDPDPGVVIAGDFNTEPAAGSSMDDDDGTCTISTVVASKKGRTILTSAYPLDDPKRFFTTWKIRGTSEVKRMIDYIFFGGPLYCRNILLPPAEEDVGVRRLPSLRFPSDHLHIAAQLEFRKYCSD
jgi:endonuclease/exonuclease/phosphatase family metal-dependent hydrolase